MAGGTALVSLISAGAALGGVALGKAFDALSGNTAWRREQRGSAYAAFISAVEAVYIAMSQTTEDYDEATVHGCVNEATRTGAVVDVFGSEGVARSAHRLWNYLTLDLNVHEVKAMTDDEWAVRSKEFRRLIHEFRDAARADLGETPLGIATQALDEQTTARNAEPSVP